MKTTICLLGALVGLALIVALPAGFRGLERPAPSSNQHGDASPLEGNVQSALPCQLEIVAGPGTAFDRGLLAEAKHTTVMAGSFRYWDEPTGRVLYVYDNVQNLVGRVVNPGSVRVLRRPRPQ